ncbi:MAG: hypothetical protein BA863_03150 [Desulfovibrio sp. S3730MH75]|nr:MAG: hypothetical protein BA863_03150 [Desulfovibrio sp. S3730MH75]
MFLSEIIRLTLFLGVGLLLIMYEKISRAAPHYLTELEGGLAIWVVTPDMHRVHHSTNLHEIKKASSELNPGRFFIFMNSLSYFPAQRSKKSL